LLTRTRLRQNDFYFPFFVGTQEDVFNLYSDVLQDFVEPFHSLLTNTFLKEAQEKKAYLQRRIKRY
jgi:hypothetical protein